MTAPKSREPIAIVLKGYPRLSETFIAQEILALEQQGFVFQIWSLRHPTETAVHALHERIQAARFYLPEYLRDDPIRVLKGVVAALRRPRWASLLRVFAADLRRDRSVNRLRRLGQALVLARELPAEVCHIHVHYLHTPASVVRYAALLSGRKFSFSAHAKDIWTTPDWEKAEKVAASDWGVTCTRDGAAEITRVATTDAGKLSLVYHGLDLGRFPQPGPPSRRDGSDPTAPVVIASVGRAVPKKGFGDLLDALARLPESLAWRFVHVGAGEDLAKLKAQAVTLGIAERVQWCGALPQDQVVARLREADLFVLPCREGADGDRDGLPNVLMEAASQGLPLISTDFAGVPEFLREGVEGLLVPPGDVVALAGAIASLASDPARRATFGAAARQRVELGFSFESGIAFLAAKLDKSLAAAS